MGRKIRCIPNSFPRYCALRERCGEYRESPIQIPAYGIPIQRKLTTMAPTPPNTGLDTHRDRIHSMLHIQALVFHRFLYILRPILCLPDPVRGYYCSCKLHHKYFYCVLAVCTDPVAGSKTRRIPICQTDFYPTTRQMSSLISSISAAS